MQSKAKTVAEYIASLPEDRRFRKLEDLPLDVVAEATAALPMKKYIEIAKAAHAKK